MRLTLDSALSSADLRELARRALPRFVFEFIDGGAEDEITLAANRAAFERRALEPRIAACGASRARAGHGIAHRFGHPARRRYRKGGGARRAGGGDRASRAVRRGHRRRPRRALRHRHPAR